VGDSDSGINKTCKYCHSFLKVNEIEDPKEGRIIFALSVMYQETENLEDSSVLACKRP
jgi:uncharacterized OB-fold protein